MKTKYHLDEIDVSQLPLPVREQLDKGLEGFSYTAVGFAPNCLEPHLNEKTGEYYTFWMLSTGTEDSISSFTIMKSPWVSPRVDKYLESIRINKEEVL